MKLALVFLVFFAIKIVGQNEQRPNALLEEDILGSMAEATRSIAKRYDIEPTCLGGVIGVYIHLMPSPNPKVWPWQMVRMFKSIRDQAVFRGERAFKKICGAGGFSPMATRCSQWGERIGGLSNSISKSKADRERNFVS